MKKIDLVVVGDGIAARTLLFELSRRDNLADMSILQIWDKKDDDKCSLKTTSFVALHGLKKGTGPLGDLLVDSYFMAHDFFTRYKPDGVSFGKHFSCYGEGSLHKEEFYKRYGDPTNIKFLNQGILGHVDKAFIIQPKEYLDWFHRLYSNKDFFSKKEGRVLKFSEDDSGVVLSLEDGSLIKAKRVVFCLGAKGIDYFGERLPPSKKVDGSFLLFKDMNMGEDSFVLSFNGKNAIYRSSSSELILGSLDKSPSSDDFQNLYSLLVAKLSEQFKIPALKDAEIILGTRQKGVQRLPFTGRVEGNVFSFQSLYKNGYSYCFPGAIKISDLIEESYYL